jgi:hypothetical protein
MKLKKCAICDESAEFSDANETLELYSERYKLVQCSNGRCKQAAWGDAYWNENQEYIAELKQKNEALCETCKDPACEDSRLAYYVTKAIKAGERIGRLEMALADIAEGDCTCFEDDSCASCRAKKELRGGE